MNTSQQADLLYILKQYDETLLTEAFRQRIRDRELSKLFAFSLHNIYRVLQAIAPLFYAGFSRANAVLDLSGLDLQTYMGSPGRVFRYFHVVLTGAFEGEYLADERIETLGALAIPASARMRAQLTIPEPQREIAHLLQSGSPIDKRLVTKLAVYMREYVDYLYMGQHDQGFVTYPPFSVNNTAVVMRRYFNLPSEILPWHTIEIYSGYNPKGSKEIKYDRFRGDIERLPAPQFIHFAQVFAPTEGRTLTADELEVVLKSIEIHIAALKAQYKTAQLVDTEQNLALMFTGELFELLQIAGEDISKWNVNIRDAVQNAHELQSASLSTCFTDVYLAQLRQSTRIIREWIERNAY